MFVMKQSAAQRHQLVRLLQTLGTGATHVVALVLPAFLHIGTVPSEQQAPLQE
jgi:hypothetical protein